MSELLDNNKSYCPAAFMEIYSDSAGRYRLCCHSNRKNASSMGEDSTAPFDYFLSDDMEDVRDLMMSGKPVQGCEKCYRLEEVTGTSYRKHYIKSYGIAHDVSNVRLKTRIYGSHCNLGCYMCHPYNSSTRRNELKEIFGSNYNQAIGMLDPSSSSMSHSVYNSHIDNILANIEKIGYLHMTGGEPLILPKYWEFLDNIPAEHAKHIKLTHNTNFTEIEYKGKTVFDYIDKFNNIEFNISADHFGRKHEWMRYPINQQQFEDNIKKVAADGRIDLCMSVTVSILNIADLLDIRDHYASLGIDPERINFMNFVSSPTMISVSQLPEHLKVQYREKYKDYPYIIAELNANRVNHTGMDYADYCQKLSDHRGFDYKELWPELTSNIIAKG